MGSSLDLAEPSKNWWGGKKFSILPNVNARLKQFGPRMMLFCNEAIKS